MQLDAGYLCENLVGPRDWYFCEMVVKTVKFPKQNYQCLHYLSFPLDTVTIPVKQQHRMDLRYLNQKRNQRAVGRNPVSLVKIAHIDSFPLEAPTQPFGVVLNLRYVYSKRNGMRNLHGLPF